MRGNENETVNIKPLFFLGAPLLPPPPPKRFFSHAHFSLFRHEDQQRMKIMEV